MIIQRELMQSNAKKISDFARMVLAKLSIMMKIIFKENTHTLDLYQLKIIYHQVFVYHASQPGGVCSAPQALPLSLNKFRIKF